MKVRISTLPPQGRTFHEKLPLSSLNQRLAQARANDLQFAEDPDVQIILTSAGQGAYLIGSVKGKYLQPCPRCLETIEVRCESHLNLILQPASMRKFKKEGEELDDAGVIYFDGEYVDLENIVQESLILATSPYGPPHPECQAAQRFTEKSAGTKLGDLLAAAQKKKLH